MNKLAVSTTAISLLLAASAGAADIRMPVKAPPPAPVAVYNWTGCYVGAGGGYGMYDQRSQLFFEGPPQGRANDNGGSGWFGTVQVGCDYQIGSNIVIGAFADYDFSGIKGTMVSPANGPTMGEEKLRNSWAAGGRIGWLPFQQRLLVFVSGGYTEARFNQITFTNAFGAPDGTFLAKHTYTGWFVGTGYEYGLGFLPGLFWKTEYRFADYHGEPAVLLNGALTAAHIESHKYIHTVRSELVWRFNADGSVGSASAADLRRPMPVKAPAPAPAVTYNWTGCYVGAGGGYGLFRQEAQALSAGAPFGLSNDSGGRGWFGTVQAGCDHQFGSNIVVGAFGDFDFSGIKGDVVPGSFDFGQSIGEEKLKHAWAAGGRVGWLPFQQLLVFVSGGYTQAKFDQVDFGFWFNGLPRGTLPAHTYSGYFVGTGYEYGIGWLPGLFWKTEYRFADYGTENIPLIRTAGVATADSLDSRKYVHTVRSELVWRFNFGGPVVARY